jgi:large subunit ribosomal protein L25
MALIVRKVNVTALYQNIPETLDIDVTDMKIGKSIKVGDLHFDGLEMATSKEVVVCTIKATRKSNAAASEESTEENAE